MCGQTVLMGFDLTWGGTGSENHLVVSLSEVGTLNSSKHMDTYLACLPKNHQLPAYYQLKTSSQYLKEELVRCFKGKGTFCYVVSG
jgi:hypothetical protein